MDTWVSTGQLIPLLIHFGETKFLQLMFDARVLLVSPEIPVLVRRHLKEALFPNNV